MGLIEVTETGSARVFELTTEQAAHLDRSRLVSVRLGSGGTWEIAGAGKVGVARVADLVVRVQPKVSIDRLFHLMGFGHNVVWRDELAEYSTADGLANVIAESFARQTDRALGRGLLHGYADRDDELSVVRGRLRSTEQVTRRFGQITPLLVHYDDFTPDVPENQILKAATRMLRWVPGVDPAVAQRLRSILDLLESVTDLRVGAPLPAWRLNRRNAHYEMALRFAEMVLRNQSPDFATGPIEMNGFMVDMAKVFEDFVAASLTDALQSIDGHAVEQDSQRLDEAGTVRMNPDLVWYRGNQAAAVIDAKYKIEKPSGYPNADLYQLLAYCTALGLDEGHLVYARGAGDPAVHIVREAGVRLVAHAVDLDQPPDHLDKQMVAIAGRVAAGAELQVRP